MGVVRGGISLLLLSLNTLFWTLPLFAAQLLRLGLPFPGWRTFWSRMQDRIGTAWISFNNRVLGVLNPVEWDVEGVDGHSDRDWYLVVANHRSWTDILVLQRVFNRKIPFLKFLLKRELIWVPFLGIAWWCLDYPFLARTGRAEKDLKAIRDAAERFKALPVSVMNFVEGTRLTPEKWERQGSPYRHLLKPRAGGLAVVLQEMGPRLRAILDVTIVYPDYPVRGPTLWEFLCGEVPRIRVRCRTLPIDDSLLGDYAGDKAFRRAFGTWLQALWTEKDEEISGDGSGPQNTGMGYRSR